MKFIVIVAVAVLSMASALPYEGIKGKRRVIPKPEPTPEEVATSNIHDFFLNQTSMMNINKQEENTFQEQTTGIKMTDQDLITGYPNTQTPIDQKRLEEKTKYSHSFDQTSLNITNQDEGKFQEQTSGTKMTDQELIDQRTLEERKNYNKMDHTLKTHKDESLSTNEQGITDYRLNSELQKNNRSATIETSMFGDYSVIHSGGVKGGKRHRHH